MENSKSLPLYHSLRWKTLSFPRGQSRRFAHMENWVYHLATITNLMDNGRKAEGRSPTLRVLGRLPPLKKWSHDLTPNLCPGQLVNPRSGEPENHHLLIYRSRRRSPATTMAVVVYHLGSPPLPFCFPDEKQKALAKNKQVLYNLFHKTGCPVGTLQKAGFLLSQLHPGKGESQQNCYEWQSTSVRLSFFFLAL